MQTQRATTNTVSETHQLYTETIPMFLRLIISILPDDHQYVGNDTFYHASV